MAAPKTRPRGSIFDAQGLKFSLKREDDFTAQIGNYMRGDSAYLRCTLGMLNQAVEALNDPRVKPVVVGQLTYSVGGDVLVVKSGIKTPADLKGKTIVLQAYGPHVDYLTRVLSDAGIALADVKIKWVKDLTGSDDSPPSALRSDPSVDAAFMISSGRGRDHQQWKRGYRRGKICQGSACPDVHQDGEPHHCGR